MCSFDNAWTKTAGDFATEQLQAAGEISFDSADVHI